MTAATGILASSSPVEHILDMTWRIGGREVPWMSAHLSLIHI